MRVAREVRFAGHELLRHRIEGTGKVSDFGGTGGATPGFSAPEGQCAIRSRLTGEEINRERISAEPKPAKVMSRKMTT